MISLLQIERFLHQFLFAIKFDYPLHTIREKVAEMRPHRSRKQSLAVRCAEMVREWSNSEAGGMVGEMRTYAICAEILASEPEVRRILEAK